MSKFSVYLIILTVIIGVSGFFGFRVYSNFYGVPNDAPVGQYSFEVSSGQTLDALAEKFKEDKVINDTSAFLWQEKLNSIKPLQTGTYTIDLQNDTPKDLLAKIDSQTIKIAQEKEANKKPSIKVTIREGLQLDNVMKILEDNKIAKASELSEFAKNPANFNREIYPFLPDPLTCQYGDLQTCAKYYIEGYVYPNTYEFFEESTPEEVFTRFLTSFNNEVWAKLKNEVPLQDFSKAVIMASVLEKETGRPKTGVIASNRDEVNVERRIMAGVFYNRLENNMKWQSDVTAEYGHGRRLCQQTLKIENCLFLDSPEAQNLYNTYNVLGYPIAPVTSPVYDNIFAVLNPTENNNLFFVSDATGKKYFTPNEREHLRVIREVNEINRSLGV
jgi:UPF0755 protein